MRLRSRDGSAESGEISLLAILESMLATTVAIVIAWRVDSLMPMAVGALIAPLLLLRTKKSIDLGLASVARVQSALSSLSERGPEWLLFPPLLLLLTICIFAIRVGVTVVTTLRHPLQGIAAIPVNWRRVVLCTDLFTRPEAVPGVEDQDRELNYPIRELRFEEFLTALKLGFTREPWLMRAFFVIGGILVYGPAMLYRWSLKASAIIYTPLLWIIPRTMSNELSPQQRASLIRKWEISRLMTVWSVIVASLFLIKIMLFVYWNGFAAWWNAGGIRQILSIYVRPAAVPPWQIAMFINACLAIGVFIYAGYVLQRIAIGAPLSSTRVDHTVKTLTLIRWGLTLYVLPCSLYLLINAALGLPWPSIDHRVFPWSR